MQIIADLQIHSKYSRATSKNMDLEHISEGAKLKGLNLVGTGDCTFPDWVKNLKEKLVGENDSGIYKYKDMMWMITGEISTVYEQENKVRKIHHLFYIPNFEVLDQVNDRLSKLANLSSDGRPIFNKLTSPEFVELLMECSKEIIVLPSHAWTPWFGVFGSKSGFDSLEECYQDQTKNIFSLETGLSSDPAMNWRLSQLDKITLMSNSDSHSPNPWRLGREANVFELKKVTYGEILDVIKKGDNKRFLYTIETDPAYGKYHFSGHKNCNISLDPKEAIRLKNKCPRCGRMLTIGVLQRVEQLADREEGFAKKDAIPFKSLLPLYEIISFALGTNQLYSKRIIEIQNKLIDRFGNELNVLLNVSENEIIKVSNEKIGEAIAKIREEKVRFEPGYDGVYGKPIFNNKPLIKRNYGDQKTLSDFKGSVV